MCSLFVSLTLVPMLASPDPQPARAATRPGARRLGQRIYRVTGRFFTGMEDGYRDLLRLALASPADA